MLKSHLNRKISYVVKHIAIFQAKLEKADFRLNSNSSL